MVSVKDAAKTAWFWVALVVGVCGLSLGIVKTAGYAKAETVHRLEVEQARQGGIVQGMADRITAIFEIERSEQYRLHHVVIPDPAAPDAGTHGQ